MGVRGDQSVNANRIVLYATTQGMAVQLYGCRQQVDPHWPRGISYLKIGWRSRQPVFHKGRELLTPVPLLPKDPQESFCHSYEPNVISTTRFDS